MPKILVFDIWGRYAHFKKIFATTSALSYAIPSKTVVYGMVGAIVGLDKFDNNYLKSFQTGECQIGLQIINPIVMQRINTNLHPHDKGLIKVNQNRKPTTVEYVYQPKYRIYFTHQNQELQSSLKEHLENHTAVYTPSLGLANLLADFEFIGEFEGKKSADNSENSVNLNSLVPREGFKNFDLDFSVHNEIIEYSQFSVEMNTEREVTKRDDVFFDRNGKPIRAFVKEFYSIQINENQQNVILF
ncbi:MAG: type I-B CRISPR-associated protein Cas5b [Saprospiraceae bacterium]|jgi:CRISPR-associated protein Cas5h|nr:type I-B CRISPR-associated protein Cas5b [Saprospiraceae bacterium]